MARVVILGAGIVYTSAERQGETAWISYDYLINAAGPKLNLAATPGLGPDGNSLSVCTPGHAEQAAGALTEVIARLRAGQRQRLVIGVGHGACTCEGAAFEYTFNVEHELRSRGLRELADVVYLTNEYELGDFGVGGMSFKQQGFITTSQTWTESLFPRTRGCEPSCGRTSNASNPECCSTRPLAVTRTRSSSTSPCCCHPSGVLT